MQSPHHLRCEYFTNPIGLDETKPRLSWLIRDERRGAKQSAYQVQVAGDVSLLQSEQPDLWDSGNVESDQTSHVEYAGKKLTSTQRAVWRVRVWDHNGQPSAWSDAASWEMGLLKTSDWKAQWLGVPDASIIADPEDDSLIASPILGRAFDIKKNITRARLYITARGLYVAHLNNIRVGDDLLTPGWTHYGKRIRYQAYDVTDLLHSGDNDILVTLGTGWCVGHVAWRQKIYDNKPWLLAQLHVEFEDGKTLTIASDESWQQATGPIRFSDMLMGERYDANTPTPRIGQGDWGPVETQPMDKGVELVAGVGPRVRKTLEIKPIGVTARPDGVFIFDMGQNMVGHLRLNVTAPRGTTVQLRHAEMLSPDGSLYTENLRKAKQTDCYTCRGDAQGETWEPSFTFHGFRYVELTGLPTGVSPTLDTVTGIVVHSDMPHTGQFECSHKLVNQLQHNIEWGQRGNYLEVPTDCPQRDERLGWMADAQVFAPTGAYNFETAAFITKWMVDVRDAQHDDGGYTDFAPEPMFKEPGTPKFPPHGAPAWADAGVIVPWAIYEFFGDKRILERHYVSMKRYLDFLSERSTDFIYIGQDSNNYGDWLNHNANTANDLIGTAYFARCADLLSRSALALGKKSDARKYASLFKKVKAAFQRRFVTPDGRLVSDTQTAYALALNFNLLPDALLPRSAEFLAHDVQHGRFGRYPTNNRQPSITTGFVGCSLINPALSDNGSNDLAYKLLLNEKYPSWLMPVVHGATTIWERWDGWTEKKGFQNPGMNSFNHYSLGAVGQWLYSHVAGLRIDPEHPGFARAIIQPQPGQGLTHASFTYDSLHGRYRSAWKIEGDTLHIDVEIPANTGATIVLPTADAGRVKESGQPIDKAAGLRPLSPDDEGRVMLDAVAGSYRFRVQPFEVG
ncbi:MAG: Bacterial alpha-L-rhamnosidase [Phycisphaera sp.]|nr:Bacterial alpha-L-rhamnosidase [Phycisphaera sp.]